MMTNDLIERCVCTLLCGAVAMPASAGQTPAGLTEMSIEDLMNVQVSTASRFPQKITEAPASVSVVTAADIKRFGYRTLADILNSMPGMYVTYDRNYQYVGVRGFNRPGDYNSRILLLVDGYRVNDAVYDTASIGQEFFLDVDLIDRVEVVRGPGSAVYGSNAVFGVVNIITKHGRDFGGLEASGEARSFGTGQGRVTYGKQLKNGADVLLSATYYDSQGQNLYYPEFNTPATDNGIARGMDYGRAKRFYGKVAMNGFTLTTAYSESTKGVPTASYNSLFNDSRTQTRDSQAVVDLAYQGALSERFDLDTRLYYGGYFYDGTFPYNQPPVTVNKDKSWAEWWGTEAKLTGRYGRHKLAVGFEYQDNFRQDQQNYDIDPAVVYLDSKQSSERSGLYIQDEVTLVPGLLLSAGARYDYYTTVGGAFNPRLGLIYSPYPETTYKLLYGTSFRAPNAYELYYATPDLGSKLSEGLQPEQMTSYEFDVEHELRPNFRITGAAYYNRIRNLIDQVTDTDGMAVFRNIGMVRSEGIELGTERAWSESRRLKASYAWQITRYADTGAELENSPRHLVKFDYTWPMFDGALQAGAELQYTGDRKTLAGSSVGGYTVVNLTLLNQTLMKGLTISASIYNLLDRHYDDPGRPEQVENAISQDGRNFRFKLTYLF